MEITKINVEMVNAKFASVAMAMKFFGFEKKSRRTFGRYMEEFKGNEDFKQGYINPTGNYVLIDIKLFEEFLRWKSEHKFKTQEVHKS